MNTYIDDGSIIAFCRTKDTGGAFSNCGNCQLQVFDDLTVKNSEVLFQALKFPEHPELQAQIINSIYWKDGKGLARKFDQLVTPGWKNDKLSFAAMRYVVRLKILQSPIIRQELLRCQDKKIVEKSFKDDFWGAKPTYDKPNILIGENFLGRIWMEAREAWFTQQGHLGMPVDLSFEKCDKLMLYGKILKIEALKGQIPQENLIETNQLTLM